MKVTVKQQVFALLDSIKRDFPRRAKAAMALMRQHGITKSLQMKIEEPDDLRGVPTFAANLRHALTPMLEARFEYAGSWKMGQEVWLSVSEMAPWMRHETILANHHSKRAYWDGSAPMIFPDESLTLFGATEGVGEDGIYLVWATEGVEPEIWVYEGLDSHKFKDLIEWLKWCSQRK